MPSRVNVSASISSMPDPTSFLPFTPSERFWDNVYESGNPANNLKGVQTYVVGPGSAATFHAVGGVRRSLSHRHSFTDGRAERSHRSVAGRPDRMPNRPH